MLLTITTTHRPATDLGYLLHKKLADSISEPAIATTIGQLRSMFRYEDSQWVEMILDYMLVSGDDRDREAQYILRSVNKVIEGL